jgi:autotransporter translocation and assembly factor TamB
MSAPLHRWAHRAGVAATALLTLVVMVLAALQLPPVATWVARRLLPLIPLNPGYRLDVARVSGDWIHGLDLQSVRLRHEGADLGRIERLHIGYDLRRLRGAETRLSELVVDGAELSAHRENGRWDLAQALRRSADTTGGGGAFVVGRVELRNVRLAAQLSPDSTLRVRSLTLRGRGLVLGKQILFTIDGLGAALAPPGSAQWFSLSTRGALEPEAIRLDPFRIQTERSDVAGRVVVPRGFAEPRQVDRLDLRLAANPLALADVAALAPAVRPEGALRLEATAKGSDGRLVTARLAARLDQATFALDGQATLERGRPSAYRAHGTVQRLDPARLLRSGPSGTVNAELDADLRGASLRRSSGTVGLRVADSRIAARTVQRVDLRGALDTGRADLSVRAEIGPSALQADGWARPFDSVPSYRLAGNARRPPGTDALARELAGAAGSPVLNVGFNLRGSGLAPATARLAGRINLTAVRRNGARIPLGQSTLAFGTQRLEVRPELLVAGGRITAVGAVQLGDTLSYQLRQGRFDGIDLGRLLSDTVAAPLSGRFTLSGRGVAPAHAVADGRLELDPLTYGTRQVGAMVATVRLRAGQALASVRGALPGGRLAVDAVARPFDSTRTFAVRHASLEDVDLGALLGRPALAGSVNLAARASGGMRGTASSVQGHVILEPSRLGQFKVAGGRVDATWRGGRLAYDVAITSAAGTLAFAGVGSPKAAVPSFAIRRGRADSLDLGALLGRPALPTDLNAQFTGELTGAGLESAVGRLVLELRPSRFRTVELQNGSVTLSLERGAVRGEAHVAGPDGELGATLTGRRDQKGTNLTADGTVRLEHLAHWTGRPKQDGWLQTRFAVQAAADSAGIRAVGGTLTGSGSLGELHLDPLHIALTPDSGMIRVDTLIVRSNVAMLDGSGRLPLAKGQPSDSLRIAGILNDPEPLAALLGADTVSLDSARVALTVAGPAERRTLAGHVDAHRILVARNLASRVMLDINGVVDGNRLAGIQGGLQLTDGASSRMRVPTAKITARYDSVVSLQASANVNDSVPITASLQGTKIGDTVRVVVDRLDLAGWTLEHSVRLMAGPRIELDSLALHTQDRRLVLNGILDRHGQSDLTLLLQRVDLDVLNDLGLSPIPGQLDGQLRLAGTAQSPEIAGKVALTISQRGTEQAVGQVQTDVTWNEAGLRLNATAAPRSGGRLTIAGTIPTRFTLAAADTIDVSRATTDSVSLALRADGLALGFFGPLLPPEAVRNLHGRLDLDAHVSGTVRSPHAEGRFSLDTAGLMLPSLRVTYQSGSVSGQIQGDSVRVDHIRLLTGKNQELDGQGAVLLRPLDNPGLALTTTLRDFQVSNSDQLKGSASGQAKLAGTLQAPAVSGRLQLGPTDIYIGTGAATAQVENVELTPAEVRRVLREFGPAAVREAHQGTSLLDRAQLDLTLVLPNRVWLRKRSSPAMNIELSGHVQLRQDPGKPMQFFGSVQPVPDRSTLEVVGREFRITGGQVRLNGPVDSAHIDVNAEYQVPTGSVLEQEAAVVAQVHAVGRPDSLALTFSSDPSMSQEDILSYIVTGQPAADSPLTAEQTTSGGLPEQLAVGQVAQAFSIRAGQGLGFDVFQIRQQGLQGLTLTAGRYLGSRLFVSLQMPLQVLQTQPVVPGQYLGPGFELDYRLRRWLQGGLTGGSLPTGFRLRGNRAY